jgi:16S rRNA G966 N2-methylase RsmD
MPNKINQYIQDVIWYRFLPLPMLDKKNLKLNIEGAYSLTPFHVSLSFLYEIGLLLEKYCKKKLSECSFLECFGGQGGDTVILLTKGNLAKLCTIEHNLENFNNLINNVTEYYKATPIHTNVSFVNDNIVDYLKKTNDHYDVIYMDPPWGGPNYKQNKSKGIKIPHSSLPYLEDFLKMYIINITKIIVLKLPASYNVCELKKKIPNHIIKTTVYDDKIRIVYIISQIEKNKRLHNRPIVNV